MSAVGDVDFGVVRVVGFTSSPSRRIRFKLFFPFERMESFSLKWTVKLLSERKPSVWLLSEKNLTSVFAKFSLQPETNGAPSLLEYNFTI